MSRIKVFIAEDSNTVRLTWRATLSRSSDFEVIGEAADGKTACNEIAKLKPDVALVDIGLPEVDGINVTKQVKMQNPETAVIIVTASTEEQTIFAAFAAGANGYIVKDGDTSALLHALRHVSTGVGWLDPAIAAKVLRASSAAAAQILKKPGMFGLNDDGAPFQPPPAPPNKTTIEVHSPVNVLLLLGAKHEAQQDDLRAEALYLGALALAEKLRDQFDMEIAVIASKVADFYYERKKFGKAEPLYLKALEIRHKALGEQHPQVARSLEDLGNLYDTGGDRANAERFYLWALSVREHLGASYISPETCSKLAWLYRAQGKNDLADQMELRARTTEAGMQT